MENTDTPNSDSSEILQPENVAQPDTDTSSFNSKPSIDSLSDQSGFQHFDLRNVSVEKVAGLIFSGVVGVGGIVGLTFLFFGVGLGWIFYGILAAAILLFAILFYFTLAWPGVEHRHRTWRLSDVGLEVRHGVWWKHRQAIPWARVQHADVSQGPLQRMYGVGTLTVHTAGTNNSSVNLAGLSHEVAIELRDEIIRQRTAGDVV